jgi:hypothetical protein
VAPRTFLLDFSCLKKGVGNLFSKVPTDFFIYPALFECYVQYHPRGWLLDFCFSCHNLFFFFFVVSRRRSGLSLRRTRDKKKNTSVHFLFVMQNNNATQTSPSRSAASLTRETVLRHATKPDGFFAAPIPREDGCGQSQTMQRSVVVEGERSAYIVSPIQGLSDDGRSASRRVARKILLEKHLLDVVLDSCNRCQKLYSKNDPSSPLLKCVRCKMAWYCSKECQRADWPRHREHCSPDDAQLRTGRVKKHAIVLFYILVNMTREIKAEKGDIWCSYIDPLEFLKHPLDIPKSTGKVTKEQLSDIVGGGTKIAELISPDNVNVVLVIGDNATTVLLRIKIDPYLGQEMGQL